MSFGSADGEGLGMVDIDRPAEMVTVSLDIGDEEEKGVRVERRRSSSHNGSASG